MPRGLVHIDRQAYLIYRSIRHNRHTLGVASTIGKMGRKYLKAQVFSAYDRLAGQVADIANFYRVFMVEDDSTAWLK